MSKQFWGILIAIALIFVGVLAFSKDDNKTSEAKGTPTNHVMGTSPKNVRLVEYGDYQCPGCGAFYSTVKEVAEKHKNEMEFQFRNLPLPSLHPNAYAAARAAEAAAMQDKFWEMHDLLYQNQSNWSPVSDATSIFTQFAQSLGLNMEQYQQDFASTKVNSLINADIAAFDKTGDQKATPTFYLNGKKIDNDKLVDEQGQPSVDAFSKLIEEALKSAN